MSPPMSKGAALLAFLKATATIRRKRKSSYGSADEVLWFEDVPTDSDGCRSPFLVDGPDEESGSWLEVRKQNMPPRPPVPQAVADWVRADDLDTPENEPALLHETTIIVEQQIPDSDTSPDTQQTMVEEVPDRRRLQDHPEIKEAWLEYLKEWKPWAQKMRRWQEVQDVYEKLDFMRRRLEEAEERYELVVAIGLLQWRDPTGTTVERHVLTAPAELALDAERGLLTVEPAVSFERFQLELDMLELQHQPRIHEDSLREKLETLDIQAWNADLVGPALKQIANNLDASAQVEASNRRAPRAEQHPRLASAPALVLRQRRPTAYENLVAKLHEAANSDEFRATKPWARLLEEGETSSGELDSPAAAPVDDTRGALDEHRFLFPLPTNEEQRQIIERLRADPCVLVKGPPGTGKSHTIANLICHLLAQGERVLVTSNAPKALEVLRDLLPDDVQDLCVTALGSSRKDQRFLEESVRGILRKKNNWDGREAGICAIDAAESNLRELEGNLAQVERDLRVFRESETHSHELPGGYSGTAGQIARRLNEHEAEYNWLPKVSIDAAFPLDTSESAFFVEAHARFTADTRVDLELDVGAMELPGSDDFQKMVERLRGAEDSEKGASRGADESKVAMLEPIGTEQLRGLRNGLQALTDLALQVERVLNHDSTDLLKDLLVGADARWTRRLDDSEALLSEARRIIGAMGSVQVDLPDGVAEDRIRTDVGRRLAHFESGGQKGFSVLAPKVVRETNHIVEGCRVNGKKAVGVEHLRLVRDHLDLHHTVRKLREVWGSTLAEASNPGQAVSQAKELEVALKETLTFFESESVESLARVLGPDRIDLASSNGRDDWLRATRFLLASRESRSARQELDQLLETVTSAQRLPNAHPCLSALADAIRAQDVGTWRTALQNRGRVLQEQQSLSHFEELLKQLDGLCRGLAQLLGSSGSEQIWRDRVSKLRQAWAWAAAHEWLRKASDSSVYDARVQDYHRLQQKMEKATGSLVSIRAWAAFLDRLDEGTLQSLNAWTRAVARIGKGTGKHAHRHRRTAQQYLMECIPSIPAWVMPLHRVWDSVDAEPGIFDTVIVDEASQAGLEALALLPLAKRIIVVGDEKQNSPEAVGVQEDDIARLAREHLGAFRFRDEFRLDASLFDHSERAFRSHITLREHFRCVPEIIRFSNDLCYRDAPMIPLRQAPPKRLSPLKSQFIDKGSCEDKGQRIQNHAEADALVETIAKLVDDENFDGKTMGVIALQGHAQARLIEARLAQRLNPKVIEERRLRCGEPATFQGDQRDVMFLSLVVAPNVHYRALTRLPDQRRFNVAMSRARDQVWLFHSVQPHDLGPDDLRRQLVTFFTNPQSAAMDALWEDIDQLERQARGPRQLGNQPDPYDSWFEVDVALELLRRKFRVRPQVEVASRRIDLVVEGIDARIAVECDGDEWHGPEQYDQDMARQRQLERAGWTFARVRESDFYADRQRAIEAVLEVCDELGIRPVDSVDETPPAPSIDVSEGRNTDIAALEEGVPTPGDAANEDGVEPDISLPTIGPFTGHSATSAHPDPRDAPSAKVREVLHHVIKQDGPLKRSSVYRLYVEGCPDLQKGGKIIWQSINKALGAMLRAGEIERDDELGDHSLEDQVLRITNAPKVHVRPAGRRDLLEIPPSELLAVLHRLPDNTEQTDTEALSRGLLEHYGFTRLTKRRREYLARVVGLRQHVMASPEQDT